MKFKLARPYEPRGDQPRAIAELTAGIRSGKKYQTLLGVTGSGKTFTMAHTVQAIGLPTLVISHNKTLAAQLYAEFKELFPENAVEYFVSYYDYYQPEAYLPQTDTFIEKDSSINEDIDRLRLRATSSLLSRSDCIIVASVSCIYGLGSPEDYAKLLALARVGARLERDEFLEKLIQIQYERNDIDFKRGRFRVRGDTVDVHLAYEENACRIQFDLNQVRSIHRIDPVTSRILQELDSVAIYPAKHFVTTQERLEAALVEIEKEVNARVVEFKNNHKFVEAQRIAERTRYDMEMMASVGYCSGIENYSRHLSGREAGSRPSCLLDYFPKDFLVMIDESHVTLPQIGGMYHGDRSRKQTLVDFGFRLPSALDNRPLKAEEFEALVPRVVFVSATPSEEEIRRSGTVVEQVIRPTGLLDPEIEIRPSTGQIDDLIKEIGLRAKKKERTLVTTLTKRMAEDLCRYLTEVGVKAQYLHSEFDAIERMEILKKLRLADFDCLIGINLLREGLDLPEVSLVAILDADKEGFLRSRSSLIQIAGRAARHVNGRCILYADTQTESMRRFIEDTRTRRQKQTEYNRLNKITPTGIRKEIREGIENIKKFRDEALVEATGLSENEFERQEFVSELERAMESAARNLQFEKAIEIRDRIRSIKEQVLVPQARSGKTSRSNPLHPKR